VEQPIQHGRREYRVPDQPVPLAVAHVGRDDHGQPALVALADKPEEVGRVQRLQRQVPQFVQDQQPGLAVDTQAALQPAVGMGAPQVVHQAVEGHEVRADPVAHRFDAQGHSQMRFPHPRRP